jgi:hypothetical protein
MALNKEPSNKNDAFFDTKAPYLHKATIFSDRINWILRIYFTLFPEETE